MEIRHLITFKTVVDVGGFTRAADHLGYAQSTVTAHIQALEQELGTPLFDRIGKKVLLTEVGNQFLLHASEMIQLYYKAKDVSALTNQPAGELRIGAPESLTIYRLPAIIQSFRKQYPKVNIIIKSGSCRSLWEELRRGELDIAFLLQAPFEDSELHTETLKDEPLVIILPPDHPGVYHSLENFKLSGTDNILFTEQGSYRDFFEAFLRRRGIQTEAGMEFWSIEAIKQCVICGLGVSMLPLAAVQSEIEDNKIGAIPWKKEFGSVATIMSYHRNKWLSQAARQFIATVKEQCKTW
jgi:DNA-binding transcriptional LysR family regulator